MSSNPRHRRIIGLYWSEYSVSQVAHLCSDRGRTVTQDVVRSVWKAAIARGDIVSFGIERPRDGFPQEIIFLGQIGNQCRPESRHV